MNMQRSQRMTARGEVIRLRLEGTLDASSSAQVSHACDEILASRPVELTLDLSGVSLIDSAGVGVIVSTYGRLRELNSLMTITGLRGQPRVVFDELKRFFKGERSGPKLV